jgi:hypothetical protein
MLMEEIWAHSVHFYGLKLATIRKS